MAAATFEINDDPVYQDMLHPLGFSFALSLCLRLYKKESCIVALGEEPSEPILVGDFDHDSENQLLTLGSNNGLAVRDTVNLTMESHLDTLITQSRVLWSSIRRKANLTVTRKLNQIPVTASRAKILIRYGMPFRGNVLDKFDPGSLPDASSEMEEEVGGDTVGEEAEEVKSTVGEEEDRGNVSDPESLPTTVSLGSPWSPKLRGTSRPPADQDAQQDTQQEDPQQSPSGEHAGASRQSQGRDEGSLAAAERGITVSRSLKKAEQRISGKSSDSTRSSSVDATRKKLTFAETNKVHRIKAENPPGDRRPGQPEPAVRKSKAKKMTESEADSILAKFAQDQQEPEGCTV
eukprot:s3366_g10.t1